MNKVDYTTVHCLFEQTHTFSGAILEHGTSQALCYDIDGNPDVKVDIFLEIDKFYNGDPCIFDHMYADDLIIAFFPCTYFSGFNKPMVSMTANILQYKNYKPMERAKLIENRVRNFAIYYGYICKLIGIAQTKNIPLIIENPAHTSFLHNFTPCDNFFIDFDRTKHGDVFKKPTFWFFVGLNVPMGFENCNIYNPKVRKTVCNESGMLARSTMTLEYAKWFCENVVYNTQYDEEELPFQSTENKEA